MGRLKNNGMALSAFRRAVDLFERLGIPSQAAEAALAAFQEIGVHLAVIEEEDRD